MTGLVYRAAGRGTGIAGSVDTGRGSRRDDVGVAAQLVEREPKYAADDRFTVPDVWGVVGGGHVELGRQSLDSVYFDTEQRDLLSFGVTLRCRTGTTDGGWQLKIPAGDSRTEIRLDPPDNDSVVPKELALLVLGILAGSVPQACGHRADGPVHQSPADRRWGPGGRDRPRPGHRGGARTRVGHAEPVAGGRGRARPGRVGGGPEHAGRPARRPRRPFRRHGFRDGQLVAIQRPIGASHGRARRLADGNLAGEHQGQLNHAGNDRFRG